MFTQTVPEQFRNRSESGNEATASSKHTYRPKFAAKHDRPAKHLEFEAPDAYQALVVAQKEQRSEPFELWCDGRDVCSVTCNGKYWQINSSNKPFGAGFCPPS